MKTLKTYYCDVKVVSTVTLQTLAESEDGAREYFKNGAYLVFDTVTPIKDVKDFGEIRNESNWVDPEGGDD